MAQSEGTLLSPKERRGIVDFERRHRVIVEACPEPDGTTATLGDEDEAPEDPKPGFLEVCWPTVLGVAVALIAERLRANVLDAWGEVGDRLVFPWVQIAGRPELGVGELAGTLSKFVLQLQFPLTGLYASWNLSRRVRMSTTVVQVVFTYGIAAFVLWLLSKPGATHGL